MRRFILRQNLSRFEAQLGNATDGEERHYLVKLIEEARRELEGLEHLWRVSCPGLGISSLLGEDGETLLDHAVQAHHAEFGSLWIWNEATSSLALIAQTNFDGTFIERFSEVRDGDGSASASALKSNVPVSVADVDASELFSPVRDWAHAAGIRAIVSAPVIGEAGKCRGVYCLYFRSPHSISKGDSQLLSAYTAKFRDLFAAMGYD